MKRLKTFEGYVNEELFRSEDDPSASISDSSPKSWDEINLTREEISFLIFIYNNFDSGGPVADGKNWKNIVFEHGKNMMKKVINGEYDDLKTEMAAPIAQSILDKMS